jgi:hypothetical protein
MAHWFTGRRLLVWVLVGVILLTLLLTYTLEGGSSG